MQAHQIYIYIENNLFNGTTSYIIENWSFGSNKTIVQHNSFINTNGIVLSLKSGYPDTGMNASENYWGTTNTSLINTMIHDNRTDITCAASINYLPILQTPDPNTPPLSGPTQVNGIISKDTTWYARGSPYNLAGNVLVNNSVMLTIEPGVTVNIGSYYLQVNGTLSARGSNSEPICLNGVTYNTAIKFKSSSSNWSEPTGSGSIIEKTLLNSTSIDIQDASPKLTKNTFTNSVLYITGGTSVVSNNTFLGSTIYLSSTTIVTISGNNISGSETGIVVRGFGYMYSTAPNSSILEGNLITGNIVGIEISHFDTSGGIKLGTVIVRNNTITNNTYGISFSWDSAGVPWKSVV